MLAACATERSNVDRLLFHVAIAPPEVSAEQAGTTRQREGSPTSLTLAIDKDRLRTRLEAALSRTFMKVTSLPIEPAAAGTSTTKAWTAKARDLGADLLLIPTLRYDPVVHSSLNDRFWLNLPLFALGGPFCWFVSDRSYYCDSNLVGKVLDVSRATQAAGQTMEPNPSVTDVSRKATEASLNFLDRADGAGPYLLSLICPAGLLSPESTAVPAELDASVVEQLCEALARELLDSSTEITQWPGVGFYPRYWQVATDGDKRALSGEIRLEHGAATELASMKYRVAAGPLQDVELEQRPSPTTGSGTAGRTDYSFRVPLENGFKGAMQIEIVQRDRFLTKRTFTYVVDEAAAR
jgi:hypothetical protein